MGIGTSDAVGFRTLQAIHDLIALAQRASEATVRRIAAGTPSADMPADRAHIALRQVIHNGHCRFDPAHTLAIRETVLLAASLPDDDFDGFLLATMILLADRLQGGAGEDDLYWQQDAFAEHYAIGPAHIRAAIVRGYLALVEEGLLSDEGMRLRPVSGAEVDQVRIDLGTFVEHDADSDPARILLWALEDGDSDGAAARLWETSSSTVLSMRKDRRSAMLSALRYLYESQPRFAPFAGKSVARVALLPIIGLDDTPR